MVRARIFLVLAFLVATFVAAETMPDIGNAAPSGCGDAVCADVAAGDACPGCRTDGNRTLRTGTAACATVCAVMTAVLPTSPRVAFTPIRDNREAARSTPSGVARAPERAPPRPSIPA